MSGTDDDGTRPGRAGSRKPRTATRAIDEVYERIARTPRVGERLREALALYARSQKWTAALYAQHFGIGADAARRDLGKLVDMNVLACIEGRGRAQGGRDPDLYALTEFGARVLSRCPEPGRCRRIRAPQVAEGEPVLTRSGLHKYKRSRKAAQDAHDLYCTRFGEHYGLLSMYTKERHLSKVPQRPAASRSLVGKACHFYAHMLRNVRTHWHGAIPVPAGSIPHSI